MVGSDGRRTTWIVLRRGRVSDVDVVGGSCDSGCCWVLDSVGRVSLSTRLSTSSSSVETVFEVRGETCVLAAASAASSIRPTAPEEIARRVQPPGTIGDSSGTGVRSGEGGTGVRLRVALESRVSTAGVLLRRTESGLSTFSARGTLLARVAIFALRLSAALLPDATGTDDDDDADGAGRAVVVFFCLAGCVILTLPPRGGLQNDTLARDWARPKHKDQREVRLGRGVRPCDGCRKGKGSLCN